jgi:hypothetical protein
MDASIRGTPACGAPLYRLLEALIFPALLSCCVICLPTCKYTSLLTSSSDSLRAWLQDAVPLLAVHLQQLSSTFLFSMNYSCVEQAARPN